MQKIDLRKSEIIFQKGDLANGLYLITQGSVGIFMPTNDGKDPDFILPANEIFGEMGVIDGELRMATARSMEPSQVLLVSKSEFEQKVADLRYIRPSCSQNPVRPVTQSTKITLNHPTFDRVRPR